MCCSPTPGRCLQGVYNPEISDHCLIYGEMTDKVCKHKPKTITFKQTRNTDFEVFNEDLKNAPWHVSDIFTCVDDMIIGEDFLKVLLISTRQLKGKE